MAQQHFDRLSALDASFLAQEDANAHMHVGAITLFEGPQQHHGTCDRQRQSKDDAGAQAPAPQRRNPDAQKGRHGDLDHGAG